MTTNQISIVITSYSIHYTKLYEKQYGTPAPEDITDDPAELAGAARRHLREKFLRAKVAISGANFAIAETA